MSQENVDVVRRLFDAVAARDKARILELYDPDVEAHATPGTLSDGMGRRTFAGRDAISGFDREFRQAFEDVETRCEELIDAGELVVSRSSYRARGRGSGIELEGPPQFGVWTVRDGRILRVVWYASRDAALEAAGMPT